jgi:hypothetical protein
MVMKSTTRRERAEMRRRGEGPRLRLRRRYHPYAIAIAVPIDAVVSGEGELRQARGCTSGDDSETVREIDNLLRI